MQAASWLDPYRPPATRESLGNVFAPPSRGVRVGARRGIGRPGQGLPTSGYQQQTIDSGYRGTAQTIAAMRELALDGATHLGLRLEAEQATKDLASKAYEDELRALFDLVRENVRYQLDPVNAEWLSHPAWTLFVSGVADCDEFSTALCALAMSIGHQCFFRTIVADPQRPTEFSHVYPVLGYRDKEGVHWFAADVTHPRPEDAVFGWEALQAAPFGYKDWPIR